jgi:FkbM family methyltransferase
MPRMPQAGPHLDVSWADHWEDVRLWRVLHDLAPGFYVDVGAMDPSADSVTRSCYDRGWHGIDVEPNPFYAARLREERPLDVVVEAAAGIKRDRLALHVVLDADDRQTGLTTLQSHIAERHASEGGRVEDVAVDVVPLRDLIEGTPAADAARFHFLKVDVEGHEAAVLAGADLARFRPMVVVVEARAPRRAEDVYEESEALLMGAEYSFAADDGLNRWYVRSEDAALLAVLAPEINPLTDGKPRRWWERAREEELVARMDELDAAARASAAEATTLRADLDSVRAETAALRTELDLILGSKSWRLTEPLRAAHRRIRRG